jgi:hypothetical protein
MLMKFKINKIKNMSIKQVVIFVLLLICLCNCTIIDEPKQPISNCQPPRACQEYDPPSCYEDWEIYFQCVDNEKRKK